MHDYKEALDVCQRWLNFIKRQKQNTITLQKASSLARQGRRDEALRLKSSVDNQPRIFDGANFEPVMPAIQSALRIAERLQSGEVPHSVIKAMAESRASCWECPRYETLGDHIGYSGENKNRIVIKAAALAMAAQLLKEIENE